MLINCGIIVSKSPTCSGGRLVLIGGSHDGDVDDVDYDGDDGDNSDDDFNDHADDEAWWWW